MTKSSFLFHLFVEERDHYVLYNEITSYSGMTINKEKGEKRSIRGGEEEK